MKTISEQLEAAKRELNMRQSVYPKWVQARRMSEAKAEHEIDCMLSIINTLTLCSHAEQVVNSFSDRSDSQTQFPLAGEEPEAAGSPNNSVDR